MMNLLPVPAASANAPVSTKTGPPPGSEAAAARLGRERRPLVTSTVRRRRAADPRPHASEACGRGADRRATQRGPRDGRRYLQQKALSLAKRANEMGGRPRTIWASGE